MDIKVGKKAIAEATEKLKNWGRWGKDDHIGTLNQVTPQDIVKAASLIGTDAIAGRQDWNRIRYADDTLMLCVQGATHWDALGHVFYEDKAYNDHDAKLIHAKGLNVLGIENSKHKMVGRGV